MDASLDFIASLPEERQEPVAKLRETILANLSPGFEERFSNGMIHFVVPHSVWPAGYHCNPKQPLGFCAIANTKTGIALHFMAIYGNQPMTDWFKAEYAKTGKKLDMGAGCIRFKKPGDIPYEVVGQLVAKFDCDSYLKNYTDALASRAKK